MSGGRREAAAPSSSEDPMSEDEDLARTLKLLLSAGIVRWVGEEVELTERGRRLVSAFWAGETARLPLQYPVGTPGPMPGTYWLGEFPCCPGKEFFSDLTREEAILIHCRTRHPGPP